MGDSISFERCTSIPSGVISTMKSGGISSWVGSEVSRIEASANSRAIAHRDGMPIGVRKAIEKGDPSSFSAQPYKGRVKAGTYDTLGVVSSNTREGAYDSNQHHTLHDFNH